MARKSKARPIAVIDFETDPFKFGRIPRPFCVEFHSHETTFTAWGPDCGAKLAQFLSELDEPHLIYAHNGGKFDIHLLHEFIGNPIKIINGRIVSCRIDSADEEKPHELRDSLSIIPIPLKGYNKKEIPYEWFEENERENHKREILEYMHYDCVYLLELVTSFNERFGSKLTVGSTAIAQLRERHEFERMSPHDDPYFRRFYYGGRVQCFQTGDIAGPVKLYDVNSMYPYVMRNFRHPVNASFEYTNSLPEDGRVYFAHFVGKNRGALPTKTDTGLSFNVEHGEFFACSHEIEAAREFGLIEIETVLECAIANETISFDAFVDDFYAQKVECKKNGDKIGELFAKFMLNSAYGKFGTNPENFEDWIIVRDPDEMFTAEENGYEIKHEFPEFTLMARPSSILDSAYFDVSIAASITSAARATLLRGLQNAIEPIYCDTDSIICRGFKGEISETELGAWKLEAEAKRVAVAGRKLYSMYDPELTMTPGYKPPKLASKGGRVPLVEIIRICEGGEFEYENPAPVFSVLNEPKFLKRKFRKTA